jgi:hypothetical protein
MTPPSFSSSEPFGGTRERVMAVDYGERRVGLAIAEPESSLVRGLPTLDRKGMKGSVVLMLEGWLRARALSGERETEDNG